MRRLLYPCVAAALAATMLLVLNSGQALATTVHCGDAITQDTRLDADLTCQGFPTAALDIYNNATLDLAGHTLTGPGTDPDYPNVGVALGGLATVENGTIRNFVFGINPGGGTLRNLAILDNEEGIYGDGQLEILNNTFKGNDNAMDIYPNGGTTTLEKNTVVDTKGTAIYVSAQSETLINQNVVTRSGSRGIEVSFLYRWNGSGYVFAGNASYVLSNNRTDYNGVDGIHIIAPPTTVTGHVPDTTLTGNHAWFNGNLGINALPGTTGGGNWAKHNGNPAQCIPDYLCSTSGKPKK
jgi:hypothetical protein